MVMELDIAACNPAFGDVVLGVVANENATVLAVSVGLPG
jgi:hypothetical protein